MTKGDTKMETVKVVQSEPPVEKEVLAAAIVNISGAIAALNKSGLNRAAIEVLLAHETKISRRDIRIILDALKTLRSRYTNL